MSEVSFPHTVPLSRPIEFGKEIIDSITFSREPTYDDICGIADTVPQTDKAAIIIGRLTGHPPQVIRKCSIMDFRALEKVVHPFFDDSQETGTSAS